MFNQTILKGAKAYQGQKVDDRNRSVANYATLVKRVAVHLKARLPPQVELDDLIQSGMIGLMDALQNFKDGQGATFETYAAIRIRGAMIDELRQSDWAPRSVHQNSRAIRESMTRLSHELGRPATDSEIASDLKVDINRYHQMLLDSNTSQVMGIEDTGLTDDVIGDRPLSEIVGHSPDDKLYDAVYNEQFRQSLADAIASLPERERNIVAFYYDEELNLREIGLIMGISESRACQVLSQALLRLRSILDHWSNSAKKGKNAEKKERLPRESLYAEGALKDSPIYSKIEITQSSSLQDKINNSKDPKQDLINKRSITSFSFDSDIPISEQMRRATLSEEELAKEQKLLKIKEKQKSALLAKTLSTLNENDETTKTTRRRVSTKGTKSTSSRASSKKVEIEIKEEEQKQQQITSVESKDQVTLEKDVAI